MKAFKQKNGNRSNVTDIETLIGPGTVFEGHLETESSVSIEGVFRGRLLSKAGVVVNRVGRVEADILAEYVVIHGTVIGNVTARKQLDIGGAGTIQGDVEAGSVTVAQGGTVDGIFRMSTKTTALPGPEEPRRIESDGATVEPDEIIIAEDSARDEDPV